ncbi:MAG TPA: hypothetical protein VK450_00050, partial [Methanomicrobiales archaeon]|nr:hypothetical protein [Methanomicrobiales archaeon]
MEILLDGTRHEVQEGATLGSVLGPRDPSLAVAVIRPRAAEAAETRTVQIMTTKGEVVVELLKPGQEIPSEQAGRNPLNREAEARDGEAGPLVREEKPLALHWGDRYAAAFGPFPADIVPARAPHRYARGDVLLG